MSTVLERKSKQQLGQFFTSNVDYIFQGFEKYIKGKDVTDPFAGSGDLLRWAKKYKAKKMRGLDIDKKLQSDIISTNDSLLSPRKYKFVTTNPPYLNINKSDFDTKNKYFSKFKKYEDLYQISLESIMDSEEGILVVPINFLSAENSRSIRNLFFEKFEIVKLNIFNHQVFEDTTYNVVSFYYKKKKDILFGSNKIKAIIFPDKKKISFDLKREHNWQFGGDFLMEMQKVKNHLGVKRLTKDLMDSGNQKMTVAIQNPKYITTMEVSIETKNLIKNNIIILKAIDSKNGDKIKLDDIRNYGVSAVVGKNTSRNIAHLIIDKILSIEEQTELIKQFNIELDKNRNKYFSLFLTNFRDNGRKRISFDFSYKLLNYLYFRRQNTGLF